MNFSLLQFIILSAWNSCLSQTELRSFYIFLSQVSRFSVSLLLWCHHWNLSWTRQFLRRTEKCFNPTQTAIRLKLSIKTVNMRSHSSRLQSSQTSASFLHSCFASSSHLIRPRPHGAALQIGRSEVGRSAFNEAMLEFYCHQSETVQGERGGSVQGGEANSVSWWTAGLHKYSSSLVPFTGITGKINHTGLSFISTQIDYDVNSTSFQLSKYSLPNADFLV